jgi:hypothetical protein
MLFDTCAPLIAASIYIVEQTIGSDRFDQYAILVADPYDRGGKDVLKQIEAKSGDALIQIRRWFLNRPICLAIGKDYLAEAMRPPISFNARQKLDMAPGKIMTVVVAYGGNAYCATPYPGKETQEV